MRQTIAASDIPPFASIESDSDRATFRIRRSASACAKRYLLSWAAISVGSLFIFLAVIAQLRSAPIRWTFGAMVTVVVFVCFVICIRVFVVFLIGDATVTFDGSDMLVQDFQRYRIPISNIRNIRHVAYPRRRLEIELRTPSWWLFVLERKTAMELELPEGRMEFFHQWTEREVGWLVANVSELLRGNSSTGPPVDVDTRWTPDLVIGSEIYSNVFRYVTRGVIAISVTAAAVLGAYTVRAEGTRKWPIVTGTVVHASLARYSDPERQTTDTGSIEYSYAVNGHQYIGRDFGFGRDVQDPVVRELILAHPDGAHITVFFNPRSPATSVLIPGATGQLWMMFASFFCPIILLAPAALGKPVTPTQRLLLSRYGRRTAVDQPA